MGDCVQTTIYLVNKLPTDVLKGCSPYEVLFERSPSLDHIRVVGCLCYTNVFPRGGKFEARSKNQCYWGSLPHKKRYKLYNLDYQSVFVNRVVVFNERVFPFKDLQSDSEGPHSLFLPFSNHIDGALTQDSYLDVNLQLSDLCPSVESHANVTTSG